ncbi:transcriptional repressor LexA [Candidatus Parcubacteria bacterium]|nr:transcriptional repressor LexA [Candidatus Parcubacteria bacterium]
MLTQKQKQIFEYIKKYIKKKGCSPTQKEIGKHFGLVKSTVHQHIEILKEKGVLNNQTRAIEIAKNKKPSILVNIPLLGTIAAGEPIEAIEDKETIEVPKSQLSKSGEHFALRVRGDSMIDEGIFDGDIVVIRKQPDAENGETVVALINDNEVTLKKIYKEKGRFRLQPANPSLKPFFTKELIVQGKVISIIRNYENNIYISSELLASSGEIKNIYKEPLTLFRGEDISKFPSTRFQGSKTKLVNWIWDNTKNLEFETMVDLFGGTGSVGYMFKQKGKRVFYNDYLKFNYLTGVALIENSDTKLTDDDLGFILAKHKNVKYPDFIQRTFKNIYYTDEENRWLDIVSTNIGKVKDKYKQALAYFSLFQSCIIKRPYNLFHRKNLYIRKANVERSFGNKTTWDKPFREHFLNFAKEVNEAIFDNGKKNIALNQDAFDFNRKADLIYIDTPYISNRGIGVDYIDFYHFLEGLCDYNNWINHVDYDSKHRKFKNKKSIWTDRNLIYNAFNKIFEKFQNNTLVISYRSDGIPSVEEIVSLLKKYKKNISIKQRAYKYALNHHKTYEVLFIATD